MLKKKINSSLCNFDIICISLSVLLLLDLVLTLIAIDMHGLDVEANPLAKYLFSLSLPISILFFIKLLPVIIFWLILRNKQNVPKFYPYILIFLNVVFFAVVINNMFVVFG